MFRYLFPFEFWEMNLSFGTIRVNVDRRRVTLTAGRKLVSQHNFSAKHPVEILVDGLRLIVSVDKMTGDLEVWANSPVLASWDGYHYGENVPKSLN